MSLVNYEGGRTCGRQNQAPYTSIPREKNTFFMVKALSEAVLRVAKSIVIF